MQAWFQHARRGSAVVVRPLARVLRVGFARGGFAGVIRRGGRILDRLAGGVLVAVARVLDQQGLGLLEAFRFASSGLLHRAQRLVVFSRCAAADRPSFGRRRVLLLALQFRARHPSQLPPRDGAKPTVT